MSNQSTPRKRVFGRKKMTEAEYDRIKELTVLIASDTTVAKAVGRSNTTAGYVRNSKNWDDYRAIIKAVSDRGNKKAAERAADKEESKPPMKYGEATYGHTVDKDTPLPNQTVKAMTTVPETASPDYAKREAVALERIARAMEQQTNIQRQILSEMTFIGAQQKSLVDAWESTPEKASKKGLFR